MVLSAEEYDVANCDILFCPAKELKKCDCCNETRITVCQNKRQVTYQHVKSLCHMFYIQKVSCDLACEVVEYVTSCILT